MAPQPLAGGYGGQLRGKLREGGREGGREEREKTILKFNNLGYAVLSIYDLQIFTVDQFTIVTSVKGWKVCRLQRQTVSSTCATQPGLMLHETKLTTPLPSSPPRRRPPPPPRTYPLVEEAGELVEDSHESGVLIGADWLQHWVPTVSHL